MKIHIIPLLVATLSIAATRSAHAQGTVIIQHSGANSPIAEGWIGGGGYPVTNDLGVNAWSTPDPNNGAANYEYIFSPEQQAGLANGWLFSISARVPTLGANANYAGAVLMGGTYDNVLLLFGSVANGDPLVNLNYGPGQSLTNTYVLSGVGTSYNLYQLIYNASADELSLWINGMEYATNVPAPPSLSGITWGGSGGPQYERVNWNLVSFEIVPEPTAISLLLLGSGVLLYIRARRMRGQSQNLVLRCL